MADDPALADDLSFNPAVDEIVCACQAHLDPQVIEGLELYNARQYFECHEVLENTWRAEKGPVRELYRGILQVAVGYYHIQRGNYVGARKMFKRCRRWLAPFPDTCQGINLAGLRRDMQAVEDAIIRLGPDRMAYFDTQLFKPVEYLIQENPNEAP
jgi:predicted metal-dependent hydrolase